MPTNHICRAMSRLTAASMALSVSACGVAQNLTEKATPDASVTAVTPALDPTALSVYTHYRDSLTACEKFERGLISANTGLNAGTDFVALTLAAVAAITVPVSSAHILAALAAITTGLKTTVAQDVTSMALTNVTIAFDKIYFEPMGDIGKEIESGLTNAKAASILTRIDSLQHNCSLHEANVYIVQNLTKATTKPASP